jgi:hypothetical protein
MPGTQRRAIAVDGQRRTRRARPSRSPAKRLTGSTRILELAKRTGHPMPPNQGVGGQTEADLAA